MRSDFVNKALEQARALQQTVGEAISKGAEQAHPLIDEAVVKANDLRDTLARGAADAGEIARPQLEGALDHLSGFIAIGKNALATGVAKAHEQLGPLAEQVRKTIESTTAAMAKKPADEPPAPDAPPR